MCGICGFNWDDKTLLKKISVALKHRGPDASGYYSDGKVSLGHRRLSIIDLSTNANQPMTNENEDVMIVFNGEIYNFLELRKVLEKKHSFKSKSDTEVILHLYEEKGMDFVSFLNGDFALAIYDKRKNKVILARDRFGIKQLYYCKKGKSFIFSSEIKSLLSWEGISKRISKAGLSDYLIYSYTAADTTILEDIKKVRPSHAVIYDLKTNTLIEKEYYSLPLKVSNDSYNTAKHSTSQLIEDAVKRRMIADVPVGAYLSGGLDSSAVVENMAKLNNSLHTFSVGFDSDKVENELSYAKIVSDYAGTKHHELLISKDKIKDLPKIVYALDEPISNLTAIPLYYLSEFARKKVTVVLNGNGSDEIFLGYRHYKIADYAKRLKAFKVLPFGAAKAFSPKKFKRYFDYLNSIKKSKDDYELAKVVLYKNFSDDSRKKLFPSFIDRKPYLSIYEKDMPLVKKMQYTDLYHLLPDNLLTVDDKMAMAHSLESRVPFLDHNLVSYAFSLPQSYKLSLSSGKKILRDIMKKRLPKSILARKKYGFTAPLKDWFEYFKNDSQERLSSSDLFNKSEVSSLFKDIDNSKINKIWQLYLVQLWADIYLKEQKIKKII